MKSILRKACCLMMCSSMIFSMAGCGADKDEVDPEVTPGQSQTEDLETNQPEAMNSEQPIEEVSKTLKNYVEIRKLTKDLLGFQVEGGGDWDIYSIKDGFITTVEDVYMDLSSVTENIIRINGTQNKERYMDNKGNYFPQFEGKKLKLVCNRTFEGNPAPYELFSVISDEKTDSGYVMMYRIYRNDTMELCYEQRIKGEEDPDIPRVTYGDNEFLFYKEIFEEDDPLGKMVYTTFPDGKPADYKTKQKTEAEHIYIDTGIFKLGKEYKTLDNSSLVSKNDKVDIGYSPILREMDGEYFRLVDAYTLQPIIDKVFHYGGHIFNNGFVFGDEGFTDIYDNDLNLIKHWDGYVHNIEADVGDGLMGFELSGNSHGMVVVMRQDTGEALLEEESCELQKDYNSKFFFTYDAFSSEPDRFVFGNGTIRDDLTFLYEKGLSNHCYEDFSLFKEKDQSNTIVCVDNNTGDTLIEINANFKGR